MAHYGQAQNPYRPYQHGQTPAASLTPPTPYGAQFPNWGAPDRPGRLAAGMGSGEGEGRFHGTPGASPGQDAEGRWSDGPHGYPGAQTTMPPSSSLAGYRHQYQPPNQLPTRTTYNPQDFAPFQSPADRPGYQSSYPDHGGYADPGRAYAPYNPAAHGPATAPAPNPWSAGQPPPRHYHHAGGGFTNPNDGVLPMPALPVMSSQQNLGPTQSMSGPGSFARPHQYSHQSPPVDAHSFPPSHPLPAPPTTDGMPYGQSGYAPPAPPPPPTVPGLPPPGSRMSISLIPYTTGPPVSMPTIPGPQYGYSYTERHQLPPRPPDYTHSNEPDLSEASLTDPLSTPPSQPPTHPLPSPPGPPPPPHIDQRLEQSRRHPQARPLPVRPPMSTTNGDPVDSAEDDDSDEWRERSDEALAQESIWREVEAAVMSAESSPNVPPHTTSYSGHASSPAIEPDRPPFSRSWRTSPGIGNSQRTNGHRADVETEQETDHDTYEEDDSDAEAEAGLEAMRLADEQDAVMGAWNQRKPSQSTGSSSPERQPPRAAIDDEDDSDTDYPNFDVSLYAGGYEGHLSYGNGPLDRVDDPQRSTPERSGIHQYPDEDRHEMYGGDPRAATPIARVGSRRQYSDEDVRPGPGVRGRKMSYENGDDASWDGSQSDDEPRPPAPSHAELRDQFSEMFYHPPMHSSQPDRPLPPIPSTSSSQDRLPQLVTTRAYSDLSERAHAEESAARLRSTDSSPPVNGSTSLAVPRSSSLSSHTSTPQLVPPVRSKTDAEERKARLLKQQRLGIYSTTPDPDGALNSPPPTGMPLDLPVIPAGKRKRLNPAKLSTRDFQRCTEPWALSSIAAWIKDISEDDTDLKETAIVNGIVALFTHKVPTMNTADAETLGARVVQDMFAAGVLVRDEEWVKLGSETLTGVVWQLTGSGCYAPRVHSQDMPGRCYSHHCLRTLKKINLQAQPFEAQRKLEDWVTFHKVKKEDLEHVSKKEVERQNILHEIVQTEDGYMDQLNVLLGLYRDQLLASNPPIVQPNRVDRFVTDVFGRVEGVKKANEDFLLAQLKYRQQEQGPWIVGFSDIFREWIRKAKAAYIEYAANFPNASLTMRKEAERNILFREFLDQARENERSKRLGWDTYLKAPITRLQRYGLLLNTVLKNSTLESEEKCNLQSAIDEIRVVTLECDARVAEMSKKVDLVELGTKLQLRPGMQGVELNLNHLGRELIFEGDLQRMGANRFTWLETHAILFDHYLVLAKTIHQKASITGLKSEVYDVSKLPIRMDLLVLEGTNDDAVVKSSVRGIGAMTSATARTQSAGDTRHQRSMSNQAPGPGNLTPTPTTASLTTTNSTSSGKSMVTSTVLEGPNEKLLFPFRVKHLGQPEVHTLFASSAQSRQDWCDKIMEAKRKHAASLFAQNAEPFRLRVVADTAFAYDAFSGGPKDITVSGTPLDRAIREAEKAFEHAGPRPQPVCRATVNCATAFVPMYGRPMVAVGTDYGVYISPADSPRGWTRAITIARVTQIAVLEEFSLFLLLADKSLIAYHLDIVCPVSGHPPRNDSLARAPQKISGNREVGFFATGRMKDRTLVFYKKRDGISSTFKVLEPVFHKSTEKKHRFSRKGTTEFFREFDEFYIASECFGINVFRSYLAVASARGFEVLNLDKKQAVSVPDLKLPDVAHIGHQLSGQKPLGMFRLNDTEFLLAYEACAVYANQHGDVSRSAVMKYVDKARSVAIYGPYILLFNYDYIEIRNAENGRRRQVIAGRDIKCLDDGQTGSSAGQRTIKIALQHPEMERVQLVMELILNDGHMID